MSESKRKHIDQLREITTHPAEKGHELRLYFDEEDDARGVAKYLWKENALKVELRDEDQAKEEGYRQFLKQDNKRSEGPRFYILVENQLRKARVLGLIRRDHPTLLDHPRFAKWKEGIVDGPETLLERREDLPTPPKASGQMLLLDVPQGGPAEERYDALNALSRDRGNDSAPVRRPWHTRAPEKRMIQMPLPFKKDSPPDGGMGGR